MRGHAGPQTDRYDVGSRYIYDLYYEKEAISRQLYDWLLKNGYADANLIAKWKKQGYEKVNIRLVSFCQHIGPDKAVVVLLEMHSDEGDKLQQHLHLQSTTRAVERGSSDPVRELWMPWMRKQRLSQYCLETCKGFGRAREASSVV